MDGIALVSSMEWCQELVYLFIVRFFLYHCIEFLFRTSDIKTFNKLYVNMYCEFNIKTDLS